MAYTVERRKEIEKEIAVAILTEALKTPNIMVCIDNGEGADSVSFGFGIGATVDNIVAQMFQTDEEHLFFYVPTPGGPLSKKQLGWVQLVYGNDGWDVISDYTANEFMETTLKPAYVLSNKYEQIPG